MYHDLAEVQATTHPFGRVAQRKPRPFTRLTDAPSILTPHSSPLMNRYSLWKYIVIAVALASAFCTRCRTSSPKCRRCRCRRRRRRSRSTRRCSRRSSRRSRPRTSRSAAQCSTRPASRSASPTPTRSSRRRTSLQAKLGDNYIVALNLLSSSPQLAGVDRRAADVSRPRPARRRAFPAAGRHEGRDRQGRRPLHHRHPLADAREADPVLGRRARGPNVVLRFRDEAERNKARIEIEKAFPDLRGARAGRERRRAAAGRRR